MSKWKLKNKVVFLSSLMILIFSIVLYFSMNQVMSNSFKRMTEKAHQNYLEVKKDYLKDLVMMAYQMTYNHYQSDPSEKSKELVKKLITSLSYQEGMGYFFVYEKKGNDYYMIIHGADQERVGRKMNTKDGDFRKKLVDQASEGGGFVEYKFERPDQNNKVRKLAYSYPFTAWNWIIMAGIYIDDVEENINEMIIYDQEEKLFLRYTFLGVTLGLLLLSIFFITFFMRRSVESIIDQLIFEIKSLTNSAEKGFLKNRGDEGHVHQEFRLIVGGVNKMLDSFLRPIESAIFVLKKIESADLSVKMTGEYQGDYALLQKALNETLDSMGDILYKAQIIITQLSIGSQDIVKSGHFLCESSFTLKKIIKDLDLSINQLIQEIGIISSDLENHLGDNHDDIKKLKMVSNQMDNLKKPLATLNSVGERGLLSAEKYSEMADVLADQAKELNHVIGKFKLD